MSGGGRPWWASEHGAADRLEPDVDPLTAHRAARRGEHADDDAVPPRDGPARTGGTPGADPADHAAGICGVCPVCALARTLGESRPDLLGHLTEAAHHLTAAARSLLDAAAGAAPPDADAPEREPVQRIDLDP